MNDYCVEGEAENARSIIERWMRMVLDTNGIERFDDLHIDQIDSVWRDRDAWLNGSSDALSLAKELKISIAPEKTLAIMCALISEDRELPIPRSLAELSEQMDWTPPSLYLFDPMNEPWADTQTATITPTIQLIPACSQSFVMEFSTRESEIRRTFVAIS